MRSREILVLGGGPAGSSAARLLARWGHAVRLITRPAGEARLAVSLPPSTYKLFDALGVTDAIARAGFVRSTGNTVWWGTGEPRVESFAGGARGWQAETHMLEAVLLAEAAAAGVSIERRAIADTDIHGIQAEGRRPKAAGPRSIVLDCTGRAGLLARARGLRLYDDGPRTIALVASWQGNRPWPVPDDSHTLIESYKTGWAWSVPVSTPQPLKPSSPQALNPSSPPASARALAGKHALKHPGPQPATRHIAVMVDPQRSGLARGASATAVYLAEIAKTTVFRGMTASASMADGPWGWDASTYRAERYAGDGWLLVGDAGSSIDPLSSAGVKKALASGWLAAVVAHTCLTRPAMHTHALEFFSVREAEIALAHASASRRFLAEAAPSHRHPFWSDRADEGANDGGTADGADGAAVRAAFEQLRRAPAINLRQNPGLVVEPRPAVSGNEIVLEPRIVTAGDPPGVRHVRDVDLLTLIELAPSCTQVPDLFEAYCRRSSPVALPDFLLVLATAVARGWLVAQ